MSGGTFSNYLSSLRTNGLAEVQGGMVRAGETLFIEAVGPGEYASAGR